MGGTSSKPPDGAAPAVAGTESSRAMTSTPAAAPPDQLRDGPCADVYALLEQCQQQKGIRLDRAMTVCVNEADGLIQCVHKHPAHFHAR